MANTSSGAIIALLPDDDYRAIRPTIMDPHLTVIYFGTWTDINEDDMKDYWVSMKKLWDGAISAEVTAESMFITEKGEWAHVDLINAGYLPDFRSVAQEMAEIHGITFPRGNGFIPHITRRYIKSPNYIEHVHRPSRPKFTLNTMAMWYGPQRWEVTLK